MKKSVTKISTDTYNLKPIKVDDSSRNLSPDPAFAFTYEKLGEQFDVDDIYDDDQNIKQDKFKELIQFIFQNQDNSNKQIDKVSRDLDKRIEYINANINIIKK